MKFEYPKGEELDKAINEILDAMEKSEVNKKNRFVTYPVIGYSPKMVEEFDKAVKALYIGGIDPVSSNKSSVGVNIFPTKELRKHKDYLEQINRMDE